jgi:hypothetical protein
LVEGIAGTRGTVRVTGDTGSRRTESVGRTGRNTRTR